MAQVQVTSTCSAPTHSTPTCSAPTPSAPIPSTPTPSTPKKVHSLFPDSPTNRLLCDKTSCGCLFFTSVPCVTPAQTYAIPPIITLKISPTSALSMLIDHEGHIEYRHGLASHVGRYEQDLEIRLDIERTQLQFLVKALKCMRVGLPTGMAQSRHIRVFLLASVKTCNFLQSLSLMAPWEMGLQSTTMLG